MDFVQGLIVLGFGGSFLYGIGRGISQSVKENFSNRRIRGDLEQREAEFGAEVKRRNEELARHEQEITERDNQFKSSFLAGRRWLAAFVAEEDTARDSLVEAELRHKERPAPKAADAVAAVRAEKRALKEQLMLLTYQLKTYEEYFPFLEEFRDRILDERVPLGAGQDNLGAIKAADPCSRVRVTGRVRQAKRGRTESARPRQVCRTTQEQLGDWPTLRALPRLPLRDQRMEG